MGGAAGNTGIGLATVGRALGLDCVIVIPNSQSQEKKDALRHLGARLIEVPVNYRRRVGESKITGSMKTATRVGARMLGLIVRYRLLGR